MFSVYPFPLRWLRIYIYINTLSYYLHQIGSMNYYPYYLGLGHETMVCALCLSVFLQTHHLCTFDGFFMASVWSSHLMGWWPLFDNCFYWPLSLLYWWYQWIIWWPLKHFSGKLMVIILPFIKVVKYNGNFMDRYFYFHFIYLFLGHFGKYIGTTKYIDRILMVFKPPRLACADINGYCKGFCGWGLVN